MILFTRNRWRDWRGRRAALPGPAWERSANPQPPKGGGDAECMAGLIPVHLRQADPGKATHSRVVDVVANVGAAINVRRINVTNQSASR